MLMDTHTPRPLLGGVLQFTAAATLALLLGCSATGDSHGSSPLSQDPPSARSPDLPPPGFSALFDGRTLDGWWGLGTVDPRVIAALDPETLRAKKAASLPNIRDHWSVVDGVLENDGEGLFLTTDQNFGDFELRLEYRTVAGGDSGIYLRGIPQVQIWDTTEAGGKWHIGADKGSGGLWNNPEGTPGRDPLVHADRPFGEWNSVRVVMIGERVSVWLNDQHVVDHAPLVSHLDPTRPVLSHGPIQLQTHGGEISWRRIWIREISPAEANETLIARSRAKHSVPFESLFDGESLDGWRGATAGYEVQGGAIACRPSSGGTLFHSREFDDFELWFEFRLPAGGNNGLAIRYPGEGDPAYSGMCELQVLDSEAKKYESLDSRQYHGSAYGMVPAHRGFLRSPGIWNVQRVQVVGSKIEVELNGTRILETDLATVTEAMHPLEKFAGRNRSRGYFGFAGHGDPVAFRNILVRDLDADGSPTARGEAQ